MLGGQEGVSIGFDTLAGDLILVGAALAWSIYTVGSQPLIQRYGPVAVTAWTLWIGSAGVVLLGIPDLVGLDWGGVPRAERPSPSRAFRHRLPVSVVPGRALHRQHPNGDLLEPRPVLAILITCLWLGEVPGVLQMVGAAVIIGGVMAAQR